MKLNRIIGVMAGLLLINVLCPLQSFAQWGIGASYEIRDEIPENGFGLRLERGVLQQLPVLDLGLRAHFSYFSDQNRIDPDDPGQSSYSMEITDYDIGVSALAGVNIGLLKPYVGLGLGSNTVDLSSGSDAPDDFANEEQNKIYWNALAGAEISAIPIFKPFVEYRYTDVGDDFFQEAQTGVIPESSNGRIIFGVLLSF